LLILYTGTKCPKCPGARKVVREVAEGLGWKEGKDFVEKLIDGADMKPGVIKLEGEKYHLVSSPEDVTPENTPAALVGDFAIEALTYQIASTPSIVINEEAVFIGEIPTKEELLKAIERV
jgi:hypothetical protein